MFTRILATAILAAGLTQGAFAQNAPDSSQSTPTADSSTQNKQTLPQELSQKLTSAGYTDVQIIPSSFLVSAKNKSGNRVMMRISPDSMTMLTEEPVSQTTGSAPSTGDENTSSTGTSDPSK